MEESMKHGYEKAEKIQELYFWIKENETEDPLFDELEQEFKKLFAREEEEMEQKDYEHMRDRIYALAFLAEQIGFTKGFKYAFQLCTECFRK